MPKVLDQSNGADAHVRSHMNKFIAAVRICRIYHSFIHFYTAAQPKYLWLGLAYFFFISNTSTGLGLEYCSQSWIFVINWIAAPSLSIDFHASPGIIDFVFTLCTSQVGLLYFRQTSPQKLWKLITWLTLSKIENEHIIIHTCTSFTVIYVACYNTYRNIIFNIIIYFFKSRRTINNVLGFFLNGAHQVNRLSSAGTCRCQFSEPHPCCWWNTCNSCRQHR